MIYTVPDQHVTTLIDLDEAALERAYVAADRAQVEPRKRFGAAVLAIIGHVVRRAHPHAATLVLYAQSWDNGMFLHPSHVETLGGIQLDLDLPRIDDLVDTILPGDTLDTLLADLTDVVGPAVTRIHLETGVVT